MNTSLVPPMATLMVTLAACPSYSTESMPSSETSILVWGVTAPEEMPQESAEMLSFALFDEFASVTGMATPDESLVDAGIAAVADSNDWADEPLQFLAAVARTTKSTEAVRGELNDIDDVLVLTLQRIDSGTGLVIRQVTGQTHDDFEVLMDSIPEMIARLYDIPYQSAGTIAESGSRNGYSYVVAAFGNPFEWIRPLARIGRLPCWHSGDSGRHRQHQEFSGERTSRRERPVVSPRSIVRPERRMPPRRHVMPDRPEPRRDRSMVHPEQRMPPHRHVMPDRPEPRRDRSMVRPEQRMPPQRHVMPDRPEPRRDRSMVRPEQRMPPHRHVMPDRPEPRRDRSMVRPEQRMPPHRHVMPDRPGGRPHQSIGPQSVNGRKKQAQPAPSKKVKPSRTRGGRGGFGRR